MNNDDRNDDGNGNYHNDHYHDHHGDGHAEFNNRADGNDDTSSSDIHNPFDHNSTPRIFETH